MKKVLFVALACLALALVPDASFAAGKKKAAKAIAGGKCTTGQYCVTQCNPTGWCSRYVCVGDKWEKRVVGCVAPWCGPQC